MKDFLLPSKCDWIKPPKTSSQIHRLPLYGFRQQTLPKFKASRKEAIDLQSEQNLLNRSALGVQHCINQKTPYVSCEQIITPPTLPSNRIVNWKLKEYFLAVRRLKSIHKQLPPIEKHHDFIPLIPQAIEKRAPEEESFF